MFFRLQRSRSNKANSFIFILSFPDTLQTFGFRGEALSALCAVAEVTIITKTEEDNVGTSYVMDHDGQIVNCESCHRSNGKNIFLVLKIL